MSYLRMGKEKKQSVTAKPSTEKVQVMPVRIYSLEARLDPKSKGAMDAARQVAKWRHTQRRYKT